ncbi:hypothetical protein [Polaribacter cellanae]|uniref:Uncharacterized protein n=1 Tax=Polaribacter cellanae TaxID=2818493 RepID=A0A975CPH8_9FLAO|nr:hypothetical protein [Polaribacter cellanae]QTE22325.1 hypothetical protein J3359_16190 [Polaribacter cellanae]
MNIKKLSFLLFLLFTISVYSQDKKIKLKSISFALGGFQPYSGDNGNANFFVSLDFTFKSNNNLFTTSLNRGFDIGLYNFGKRYNLSIDVLYGREIKILNWLKLELHTGIGVFRGSYYKNEGRKWKIVENANNNKNHITPLSIAFPSKFKLLFYLNKKSSLGINLSTNVNNISNYIAYNLIYQKSL